MTSNVKHKFTVLKFFFLTYIFYRLILKNKKMRTEEEKNK